MVHLKILIKWILFYFTGIIAETKIKNTYIYFACFIGFSIGFILRGLRIYPGKPEPLYLDGCTAIISLLLFLLSILSFKIPVKYGLLLIFSLHLIYNLYYVFKQKNNKK